MDLDNAIKSLSDLSTNTKLYKEFEKLGTVHSLLSLLTHPNKDIVIEVIVLLNELLGVEDSSTPFDLQQMLFLLDSLVDKNLLQVVVQHLIDLQESVKEEKKGRYACMELLENCVSLKPQLSSLILRETNFLSWCFQFCKKKLEEANKEMDKATKSNKTNKHSKRAKPEFQVDENLLYSTELVSILFARSSNNSLDPSNQSPNQSPNQPSNQSPNQPSNLSSLSSFIDSFLLLLSVKKLCFQFSSFFPFLIHSFLFEKMWQKRDPHKEEEEVVENLKNALCASLLEQDCKTAFKKGEGFQLMLRFIK